MFRGAKIFMRFFLMPIFLSKGEADKKQLRLQKRRWKPQGFFDFRD
jgi:hypothetical protein